MVQSYNTQRPETKAANSRIIPVNRPTFGQKKKVNKQRLAWQIGVIAILLLLVFSGQSFIIRLAGAFGEADSGADATELKEIAQPVSLKGGPKKSTKPKSQNTTASKPEVPVSPPAASGQFKAYIERFAPLAVAEHKRYGIPASVILAQGLLESNAGKSRLAVQANNHFGIKCFSRKCRKGHCVNYTDDTHKDFFMKYGNVWASYRAHSEFLHKSARYKSLFKLSPKDYQGWARGLARLGYATDPGYGEKLIAMIQSQGLQRYD